MVQTFGPQLGFYWYSPYWGPQLGLPIVLDTGFLWGRSQWVLIGKMPLGKYLDLIGSKTSGPTQLVAH